MTSTMDALLQLALPLVTGLLTFAAVQMLKWASPTIDAMQPLLKRLVVLLLAFGITAIAAIAGVPSPCSTGAPDACLGALTPEALQTIIAALIATGMHTLTKPA
jgi:hypothetical protein